MTCLGVDLFVVIMLGYVELPGCVSSCFSSYLGSFQLFFFPKMFLISFSPRSSRIPITRTSLCLVVPTLLRVSINFSLFSDCVIFLNISLNYLIFPSGLSLFFLPLQ